MCRAASGVILWGNIKLGQELRTAAETLISTVDKVTVCVLNLSHVNESSAGLSECKFQALIKLEVESSKF